MLENILGDHGRTILSKYSPQILKNGFHELFMFTNKYKMKRLYKKYKIPEEKDKKVLFWEAGGMPGLLTIDAIIAFSMRLRGVDVHMAICDGTYHACIRREIRDRTSISDWSKLCEKCKNETTKIIEIFNLPYSYFGDYITEKEKIEFQNIVKIQTEEDLEYMVFDSVNIGTNIKSSIERYLMGSETSESDEYEQIVKEYIYSGLICASCASNLIKSYNPSHCFMAHGIYIDWGPARRMARYKNIPVSAWGESYLQGHYFFGHNIDTMSMDFFNISETAWTYYKNAPLIPEQMQCIDNYLKNRYQENLCMDLRILSEYTNNNNNLLQNFARKDDKPLWAIFSHLFWDNASDFSPLAYNSFNEWMIDTINTIRKIPEVNWLIKSHPAEVWWGDSDRGLKFLIEKNFQNLPENIKIIPPDAKINPLDFYNVIDGGITSCGTVGMELSLLGKPVIVAGRPHYSGKGFTYDGFEPEEYRTLLKKAKNIKRLKDEQILLAKKYAYCYFIRKQIPLLVTLNKDPKMWVGYVNYKKINNLIPNSDPIIDFICEKIFDGSDFIMDDRLVEISEKMEA